MDSSATLGDLLLTLYEMGFTELQVRAAIRAGSLSVQEATDWLLQERGQRLQIGAPRVPGGAMAAFNPPKCQEGPAASSPEHSLPGVGPGSPPRPGEAAMQSSQARVPRQGFEEQEQLAQEAKAERATKRKEHELALQRIADDRRSLQAKAHFAQKLEPSPAQAPLVAGSDGQQCLLMIRLPSGDSVRERFPATFPLQCVHQHVLSLHPELPPAFTFLQGFPKRHFGPAELPSSLQALGLTPSATLCVLGAELPQPAAEREPESPGPPPRRPQALPIEHAWGRGEALVEEALGAMAEGGFPLSDGGLLLTPAHRVVLDSPLRVHGLWESAFPTHHHWGQGQRLVPQDPLGRDEPGEEEEELPLPDLRQAPSLNRSRGSPASPHQWPAGGNRLRAVDTGDRGGEDRSPELPVAAAQAAEQRLHQGAVRDREDEKGRPVAAVSPQGRLPLPVPSLFHMALQAAIALLTAPRKQYCSSLSALTAPLAECLFTHMIQQGLLRPRSLELFFSCPLQTLRLDCYPYATNALLHQLRALPSLRHLSLVACSLITDQGLSVLPHLHRLQQLNLSACLKLTDNCLHFVKGLPQLSHLALDQTRVSDAGLAEFLRSEPSALTHLSLNRTGVTESTLCLLPLHAPQLRVLSVKQTGISDCSVLRQLCSLHTLHLDGTSVSESSLAALASHPGLSTLTLSGVQSVDSNRALQLLSGLPLVQLTLPSRHTVTDAGLASLCQLDRLVELDLTDYTHISDEGLQHLPRLCRLRRLALCNTLVTDGGLQHVQGLQHLEELCLDRTNVSSLGVAQCITRLPHLQVLSLASTPVGDSVARLGIARCKHLLKLNMSHTRLTDRGLRHLRHVPITQLNLDGSAVTGSGVARLLAACPSIVSVRASHLRTLPAEQLSDEELPPA